MVEYTLVNVITVLLGLGFLAKGYQLVRSGREDLLAFLVSSAIGIGLVVVALVPSSIFDVVADVLGIQFKAIAVLIVSNLTLFLVVAFLFDRLGRVKQNTSQLNEELSLLRQQVHELEDGSDVASDDD